MKRFKHTTNAELEPGTIVIIDLDRFSEVTEELGLDEYKPNFATGELTSLVEQLVRDHRGVVVYGLDSERGTEEAVLEFPYTKPEELIPDLERLLERLRKLNVTATAVVVEGMVSARPALRPSDAYRGTPWRSMARRALHRAKRKGGNRLVVL